MSDAWDVDRLYFVASNPPAPALRQVLADLSARRVPDPRRRQGRTALRRQAIFGQSAVDSNSAPPGEMEHVQNPGIVTLARPLE